MKHILVFASLAIIALSSTSDAYSQIEQIIGISDPKFSVMRDHYYAKNPKYTESSLQKSLQENGRIEHYDKNYTHFKRWEEFWSQRLMPDGTFPNPNAVFSAIQEKSNNRTNTNSKKELVQGAEAQWKVLGPVEVPSGGGNGRINCIQMHPNLPSLIWAGSAAGGAWKSTDFGQSWVTTCDDLLSLGVSDIALQFNNPNIVYLATGDDDAGTTYTIGVLKSTDAGKTWNPTGLSYVTSSTQQITRLLAHPTIAGKLYAATSQGLYVTIDAGVTWTKKSSLSFRDLEMRTDRPDFMIASLGSEIHRSTDGGNTWAKVTTTIPTTIGRIALSISPANQDYMYALCSDNSKGSGFGGLYRSIDGGKTWALRSSTPNILTHSVDGSGNGGQGWYDLAIACSYTQPNHIIVGGVNVWKSTDGGANWTISAHWYGDQGKPYVHADVHDIDYLPTSGNSVIAGCDGGVFVSTNNGTAWTDRSDGLEITQYYHIATSQSTNPIYIGGAQDNGTTRLSSNAWRQILGGDGMKCLINPTNSKYLYGAIQSGALNRSTDGGESFQGMINPDVTSEPGRWVTPYVFNPKTPSTLYAGFKNIWKSTSSGAPGSWKKISTFSNTSSTIKLIAISPANPDRMIAMNDNVAYESIDGGVTWTLKSLGSISVGSITSFAYSANEENKAWITIGGFGNSRVFKSVDTCKTWQDISAGLPKIPTNVIIYEKDSPERVYIGNDLGVYYRDSTSNGWIEYSDGLPNTIVKDLDINYQARLLLAGTYGRGLWKGNLVGCTGVNVSASVTGALAFCQGDSTVLTANGNFSSYRWSNGNTTKSIVVKTSGEYTVTVTDTEGCTGTSTPITIDVVSLPDAKVSTTKTTLCEGDSTVLDAGAGFKQYLWSNGEQTQKITIKKSGKYSVTVKNSTDCSATSPERTITVNSVPATPIITRDSNTLSCSVFNVTYQWFEDGKAILSAKSRTYTPPATSYGKKITVKVTSSNCSTISEEFLFSPLGINEGNMLVAPSIYPNPTNGFIVVDFISNGASIEYTITDNIGKQVFKQVVQSSLHGKLQETLDLQSLSAGPYVLTIKNGNQQWTTSIIKH